MAESIAALHAQIYEEFRQLQCLTDQVNDAEAKQSELIKKIFDQALPRWDYDTFGELVPEFGEMADYSKERDATTATLESINARFAEVNVRYQSEPNILRTKLIEILRMAKEARHLKEQSFNKLREINQRLEVILDQATPKA